MKTILWQGLALLLVALLGCPTPVFAQGQPAPKPFKSEEIDQLVAPIALYPDALLAQVLMASTYPLDIVNAARFAKSNANLKGDQLNEALKKQPWDDSVKSLVSFPQVLTMMSEKLDWTQKLGDAFLAQQKEVMAGVQRLRAKAHATGNLKTTAEQKVTVEAVPAPPPPAPAQTTQPAQAPQTVIIQQPPTTVIKIEPANPQVIYVPTYSPTVVYGAWPYPAYPPPPPYYPPGYTAAASVVAFGAGMAVGAALWGDCNWHGGDVNVNVNQYNSYTKNVNTTNVANQRVQQYSGSAAGQRATATPAQGASGAGWQHNAERRGAVPYRDQATAQSYGRGQSQQAAVQSREAFRGRAPQAEAAPARGGGAGPQAGTAAQRPATTERPATMERGGGSGTPGAGRGQAPSLQNQPQPGAFEGIGRGGDVSGFSSRGGQSLESARGSRAGGAGGGGGRRR